MCSRRRSKNGAHPAASVSRSDLPRWRDPATWTMSLPNTRAGSRRHTGASSALIAVSGRAAWLRHQSASCCHRCRVPRGRRYPPTTLATLPQKYGLERASNSRLNGVCTARLNRLKRPPSTTTSRSGCAPVCARGGAPRRASDTGTHACVDAPYITLPTGRRLSSILPPAKVSTTFDVSCLFNSSSNNCRTAGQAAIRSVNCAPDFPTS